MIFDSLCRLSLATVGICLIIAKSTVDEPAKDAVAESPEEKYVLVESVEQAGSIASDVHSVRIDYSRKNASEFSAIIQVLSDREHVQHFEIHIPNSSGVKDESLKVLSQLRHARSLSLQDDRDWKSPEIFGYIAAMKRLEVFKCEFR